MKVKDQFLSRGSISALKHVMKLILGRYALLAFINRICKQYLALVNMHNVEVYIHENGCHISALTHARALIFRKTVLL